MRTKKLIVANWKMNPTTAQEAVKLFNETKKEALKNKNLEVVVCPPFIYIPKIKTKDKKLRLGAQDVFYDDSGNAHTGEISAKMLKSFGVKYAIIGHSERRSLGETDEIINKKIFSTLESGLKVIFCVGEKERDADGKYFEFIRRQTEGGLRGIKQKEMMNLTIAYEPSWAISGGGKLNPDNAESVFGMTLFIKKTLLPIAGDDLAREMPIIYGGSVSAETASGFMEKGGICGFLVGKNSLDPKEFGEILKAAENS